MPAVFVNRNRRIVGANGRAAALNPKASEDRPFALIFRQPNLSAALDACLNTGTAQTGIYEHSEGAIAVRYDVTFTGVEGLGEDGVLLCFNDVTHLRQADRMRREFVANVSHELRTPLTAILGYIETILGPARDDRAATFRFLETMADEAQRMNRLVADLLSLSRVEETARIRPTEEVDIVALIRSAANNLEATARDTGGTIRLDLPESAITLRADPDQMRQVLSNLIENALKYGGDDTTVTLSCRSETRDPDLRGPACVIAVADNGPGIDPIHLTRLTERFYRIDSHRSRQMGGTGLGLAIVKHILNRHRGQLRIDSAPGKGSRFSVILPK